MTKEYYFISDMHIGGDGALNDFENEKELIEFLQSFYNKNKTTELIIVGDAFSLWEITKYKGIAKLDFIIRTHKKLFNQFKKTGEKINISIIPGNHDQELLYSIKFKKKLAECNINLEQKEHIIRKIKNRKIWIEHGHQQDAYTRFEPYDSKEFRPLGFYTTTKINCAAQRISKISKRPWLRYIESVVPEETVPYWIFSNYFYKEMNPILRWILLPFILMLLLSIFILGIIILNYLGIMEGLHYFLTKSINSFGIWGKFIWIIISIDIGLIISFIFISIPGLFVIKDIKRRLVKYGIIGNKNFTRFKGSSFEKKAKKVFKNNKSVDFYVYAHTHRKGITKEKGNVIINTGTWLRKVYRVKSKYIFLPDIFYSKIELSYFIISCKNNEICVEHKTWPKKFKPKLTLTERLFINMRRTKKKVEAIAKQHIRI